MQAWEAGLDCLDDQGIREQGGHRQMEIWRRPYRHSKLSTHMFVSRAKPQQTSIFMQETQIK